MDPANLRRYAHDLGEAMGLLRDRLDKDLSLYAGNLEKMAQAVELMEETVAAERRKRERQQAAAGEQEGGATEPPAGEPASEAGVEANSAEPGPDGGSSSGERSAGM